MSSIKMPLLRLAISIHDNLLRTRPSRRFTSLPTESWLRTTELLRRLRRAELRDWQLAANVLRHDLRSALALLHSELSTVFEQFPISRSAVRMTTPHQIYADLVALEAEFGGIDYCLRERRISVTTEPVELAGVYLGPFEIQLYWSGQGAGRPTYRVIAQDPHPPDSRPDVTHPHVADGVLCEGEGKNAIRQALEQARLLDFFTLAAGVLRTYNADSPFVELELWRGVTCADCGTVVEEGEAYACQACGETVCSSCEACCAGCQESYCSQCVSVCAECEEAVCRRCLKICSGCRRRVCAGCLNNDERCSHCHENEPQDESAASAPIPEVQPLGMGQAALPA